MTARATAAGRCRRTRKASRATLLRIAEDLLGGPVDIQGAGRTDAGVHALAQVAHLETTRRMPPRKLLEGLNDALPSSINILRVEEAPPLFTPATPPNCAATST
jgi:tRNA pseudouridine38-40 synthase